MNNEYTENIFSHENLISDTNYYRAQNIAKKMLDIGIISADEYDKLSALNLKTFSPIFAGLFPKTVDLSPHQR